MQESKKWWSSLDEKTKWNLTINYTKHWVKLTDAEILDLYKECSKDYKDEMRYQVSLLKRAKDILHTQNKPDALKALEYIKKFG